jgi:hypothetical protein
MASFLKPRRAAVPAPTSSISRYPQTGAPERNKHKKVENHRHTVISVRNPLIAKFLSDDANFAPAPFRPLAPCIVPPKLGERMLGVLRFPAHTQQTGSAGAPQN